jgi:hypothetical protein
VSDAADVTIPRNKINFGKNRQNALYFWQDLGKPPTARGYLNSRTYSIGHIITVLMLHFTTPLSTFHFIT